MANSIKITNLLGKIILISEKKMELLYLEIYFVRILFSQNYYLLEYIDTRFELKTSC